MTIVLSGINLFEGGPVSVYRDCLSEIVRSGVAQRNRVIAFVHKAELFSDFSEQVTLIELPRSRTTWLFRLWYEYVYFYWYSRGRQVDVWLSMHDISPCVRAARRYVYCHNPSPFMRTRFRDIHYSYKNALFSVFYRYLYRINIRKNVSVIVQQEWMRREFIRMFGVSNVIVARPSLTEQALGDSLAGVDNRPSESVAGRLFTFIYPAYARSFKNVEVVCEACRLLQDRGLGGFQVLLTMDGTENRYSRDLVEKYGGMPGVNFIGVQSRSAVFELYRQASCLVFPSLLETWGLPISEFKQTRKPILAADLPYAHETVGSYDAVCFFPPSDAVFLSELMQKEIQGIGIHNPSVATPVSEPFAADWGDLLAMLLREEDAERR
jgi:glycosyltransferase involved in cell wall biosynthesis